jgi:glycerol-3-phosphate dehydrogenase
LQSNADLGQALAALESSAVVGTRVLDCDSNVHTVILEQPFDDREVVALSGPSHGEVVVGRWVDACVLQQSLDDREVAFLSSPSHGVVAVSRRIDALVLEQSFDDREVAVHSSLLNSNGTVAVGRRLEHRVSEQIIDDVDVVVLSGPQKGFVETSVDKQLAGFEHALHNRQSTIGSVITECE